MTTDTTEFDPTRWVVGRGNAYGWVSVDLGDDDSFDAKGAALDILWEHDSLQEVALLTNNEWIEHEASQHCGISHIDRGLEVLH